MEIENFLLVQGQVNCHNVLVQRKFLLVRKNRLAYIFLCLNNLHFRKQYETRFQLSCKQCRSRSAGFRRSQLIRIHTVFNATCELVIINQNMICRILYYTLYTFVLVQGQVNRNFQLVLNEMGPGRTSRAWYFHSPVLRSTIYCSEISLLQKFKCTTGCFTFTMEFHTMNP